MAILFEVAKNTYKYYLFCQNFLTPTIDKRVKKANSLLSPILLLELSAETTNDCQDKLTNKLINVEVKNLPDL